MFIRCETVPFMLEGKTLLVGDCAEVSKETLAALQHLIDGKVITVHQVDPNAAKEERKKNKAPSGDTVDLGGMRKVKLISMAEDMGISLKGSETKASIIEEIEKAKAGQE